MEDVKGLSTSVVEHLSACALQLLRLPTFSYPPPKEAQQPPTFRPMSVVAKRSPISATAEPVL